jgi:histidine triad (HIT) family protein
MAPACRFCQIIAGAAPAFRVMEDEVVVAFLDIRPLFPGHVLVSPREHHETLADLPPSQVEPLFRVVRRLSAVIPSSLAADGTFVACNNRVSQSVPHLHVHVVPRRRGDGLRGFFWPRTRYDDDHAATSMAERLALAYSDNSDLGDT